MDENKEVNSTDPKREKVRVIPLSAIDDAPDHPFGVWDDDEMAELVESISTFGVINPVIVRKDEGKRYELISWHRRKYACSKLGIETLQVIVRDLTREEAIIFMVDSNLQREHILPSERAKAYKMKMEAMRKTAGRPFKNNPRPLVGNLETADIMLNLPVPKANYQIVKVAATETQKKMIESFAKRAEKIHNKMGSSNVDNMLMVTNDGRKAALDQRLINPMLPTKKEAK